MSINVIEEATLNLAICQCHPTSRRQRQSHAVTSVVDTKTTHIIFAFAKSRTKESEETAPPVVLQFT